MAGPTSVNTWGWYKADSLAAGDGDTIATFTDSSGNARDLTSGTGIYKTAIQASLPVVRFDGLDDGYTVPDMSALTAGTVFVVLKINLDPPVAAGPTGLWDMGTTISSTHYPYTDGIIYDGFGSTTRQTVGDPTPSLAADFRVYCVTSAAGAWTAYLDNTQLFTTGTNTVGFPSAAKFGFTNLGINHYLAGDVGELVLYDSALGSTDRTDTFNALYGKWFPAPGARPTFNPIPFMR